MFIQHCQTGSDIEFHLSLEEIDWLRKQVEERLYSVRMELPLLDLERVLKVKKELEAFHAILLHARHFHPQTITFL